MKNGFGRTVFISNKSSFAYLALGERGAIAPMSRASKA
jgi:hypothetical protein